MNTIRGVLAGLSVLLVPVILGYTYLNWEEIQIVKDVEFNDLIKAGVQLKVEQSRSEFQLALLIMGAVWTLIIAKKDEAGVLLSDTPELIMFCSANILLLLSTGYHLLYVEDITNIYSLAGGIAKARSIPDVFHSGINNPYRFQFYSLVAGAVVTAITLFSAHKLK